MKLSYYWWWSTILLSLCITPIVYSDIFCVDHSPQPRGLPQSNTRLCEKAGSNVKKASGSTPNKVYYSLHCSDTDAVCSHVNATLHDAVEILTNTLLLESPLYVNVSYFSFCESYDECTISKNEISIGQAYPSVSYLMIDKSDNTTRMYPQATLKQFTQLKPKPQWLEYDIIAEFNSDNNWYYSDEPNDIDPTETDLLRTMLHELVHGLGFVSAWSDELYQRFEPYVDNLIPFLTPMLLVPPEQLTTIEINENTDEGNQPFWGFVECPLDKFMVYHSVSMSTITNLLNNWGDANVLYNTIYDMVNAWVDSDLHLYAQSAYHGSTTPQDIVIALPNRNNTLLMETSLVPFADGSTLSHVDYSSYHNTADYLMTYTTKPGVAVSAMKQYFPTGPLGPELLHVLASLGYRIQSSNVVHRTLRPKLAFWNPPKDLVGTTGNPSASASVVSKGPARSPTPSSSPTSSSTSYRQGFSLNALRSHPILVCITLLFLHSGLYLVIS